MSEEIQIEYIRVGVIIGKNRVGFIELPKDITTSELKAFIKQCKLIKQY